jgi:hypothetical protein
VAAPIVQPWPERRTQGVEAAVAKLQRLHQSTLGVEAAVAAVLTRLFCRHWHRHILMRLAERRQEDHLALLVWRVRRVRRAESSRWRIGSEDQPFVSNLIGSAGMRDPVILSGFRSMRRMGHSKNS